jgi:hypothetical protein
MEPTRVEHLQDSKFTLPANELECLFLARSLLPSVIFVGGWSLPECSSSRVASWPYKAVKACQGMLFPKYKVL